MDKIGSNLDGRVCECVIYSSTIILYSKILSGALLPHFFMNIDYSSDTTSYT